MPRLAKKIKEKNNKKKRKRPESEEKKIISDASDTDLGDESAAIHPKVSFLIVFTENFSVTDIFYRSSSITTHRRCIPKKIQWIVKSRRSENLVIG